MLYVFDDAKVADMLRDLGFFVFETKYGASGRYAIEKTADVDKILHQKFADQNFKIAPCLCF